MEKAGPENYYLYNPRLKSLARELRRQMSKGEACLWKYVLSRAQMKGYNFCRQRPVLDYIADFMCKELLLIVEVDGIFHDDAERFKKDQIRDSRLQQAGFTILHFSDWEVLNKIDDVAIIIGEWIDEHAEVLPRKRKG
jgi:very-short-patch-repair endonuclease